MRIRMNALALATIAGLGLAATSLRAEIDGTEYSSGEWGVALSAPKNWRITESTSYPSVLVVLVTRAPAATIALSAQELDPETDALAFARETAELLGDIGFETRAPQLHAPTGAYWIDAQTETSFLRQAFVEIEGTGFALTMSAASRRDRAHHLRSFDFVLRSIHPVRGGDGDVDNPAADAGPGAAP